METPCVSAFLLGSAGIVINRMKLHGITAGIILNIFLIIGLLILAGLSAVFIGVANKFEEKQQTWLTTARCFYENPSHTLGGMTNDAKSAKKAANLIFPITHTTPFTRRAV